MASDDRILKILLQLQSDISGLAPIKIGVGDVKGSLEGASKSAFTFTDAMKFAGAEQAGRIILDVIKEIPSRLIESVRAGVEFNAEIQNIQNGIAAVLQLTQGSKFLNFDQAKAEAGNYIDTIKAKANDLGIAYTTMLESVQHTQAQLASAGVNDINKAIELTVSLNRAMQAVGTSSTQAARDIGDILQGQAARTLGGARLASAMGMSKEGFDDWIKGLIQTGELYEGLTEKLGPFQSAAQSASTSFNATVERMKNALLDLESEAAKPIMAPLQSALEQTASLYKTDELKAYARTLGDIVTVYLAEATALAQLSVKLGEVINQHRELAGLVSALPGGGALASIFSAVADSHDNNLAQIQFENMQKTYQSLREQALAAAKDDVAAQEGVVENIGKAVAQLHEQIASGQIKNVDQAKLFLENMNQLRTVLPFIAGTIGEIAPKLAQANAEVQKLLDAEAVARAYAYGSQDEIAKAEWGQKYNHILEERKKLGLAIDADTVNNLVDEQTRGAERKKELSDTQNVRSAQKDITDFTREQSLLLQQIHNAQQVISANPFLSADDKQSLSIPLIISEIGSLNAEIQKGESLMHGGTLDPGQYDQVSKEVDNLRTKVQLLGYQLQQTSFTGGFTASLTQWSNSFGTAAQQAAGALTGTLNTAIGSTSQALTGLIFQTGNWRQTFASAAQQIVQSLIRIALQFVVSRLIMAAVNRATGASEGAAASAQASTAAAAWAAPAVSASIATYGTASGAGLAAYLSALAAGAAGIAGGGLAGGGRVPGSPSRTDNMLLPMATGEHVLSAHSTQWVDNTFGPSFLDDLNSMRVPSSGLADGGRVGADFANSRSSGGGAGIRPVINQALFFDVEEARKWLFDRDGERHIVDIVKGNLGS